MNFRGQICPPRGVCLCPGWDSLPVSSYAFTVAEYRPISRPGISRDSLKKAFHLGVKTRYSLKAFKSSFDFVSLWGNIRGKPTTSLLKLFSCYAAYLGAAVGGSGKVRQGMQGSLERWYHQTLPRGNPHLLWISSHRWGCWGTAWRVNCPSWQSGLPTLPLPPFLQEANTKSAERCCKRSSSPQVFFLC